MSNLISYGLQTDDGQTYDIIPPTPTESYRGGLKAETKTTDDTVEVKVGADDKGYVAAVATNQSADDYGKILTVNDSGRTEFAAAPAQMDINYDETKGRLVVSEKTNLPGNTSIDPSLSKEGDAADAKATGKALAERKSEIDILKARVDGIASLEEGSTTGDAELQDIRVGYDGTTYENAGEAVRSQVSELNDALNKLNEGGLNIKDEVIAAVVNNWLDEHPEATTTVQKKSLINEHFTDETVYKVANNYVNVLSLGVDNTGETDCSSIIKNAIKNNTKLYFPPGTYIFENSITIDGINNLEIFGEMHESIGSILKYTGTGELFSVLGMAKSRIHHIVIHGNGSNNAIRFYNGRSGDTYIDHIYASNVDQGIIMDSPSGYNYFEYNTIIPKTKGIAIGDNFTGGSVSPNYIYINHCNVLGVDSNKNAKGISIHYANVVYINQCDIANFKSGYGIYIEPLQDYCISDLFIANNAIFNNKMAVYGALKFIVYNLNIENNFIMIPNIDSVMVTGIKLEKINGNILGLFVGYNSYRCDADDSIIDYFLYIDDFDYVKLIPFTKPCYIKNNKRFDKKIYIKETIYSNQIADWIGRARVGGYVEPGSSRTCVVGNAEASIDISGRTICVETCRPGRDNISFTKSYDDTTNSWTVVVTNNNDSGTEIMVSVY